MKLQHDPFQIFRSGKSPAALYARQKWLGEAGTLEWQRDYNHTVANLLAGQDAPGSWGGSVIQHEVVSPELIDLLRKKE